jgi:DNA-binding transcriptional regulator YiaG
MAKIETIIKSEIVRLTKREIRKITLPLGRDVRLLKAVVSKLRRTILVLERSTARQALEMGKDKMRLEATPDEVKASRFSPRLIRALRERLGLTQKEMATLAGVTIGAIFQWEKGIFEPRGQKKGVLVALRKLGRREVRRLLEERRASGTEKKTVLRRKKTRRTSKK